MENPYYRYFIGLPGYRDTPLFDASFVPNLFRLQTIITEFDFHILSGREENRGIRTNDLEGIRMDIVKRDGTGNVRNGRCYKCYNRKNSFGGTFLERLP